MKTFRKLEEGDLVKVYSTDNDNVYWTLVVESTDFTKLNYGEYESIKFFKNKAYDYLQNVIDLDSLSFFDDAQDESKWTISGLVFDCGDGEVSNETPFQKVLRVTVFKISTDIHNMETCKMDVVKMLLKAHNTYYRNEVLDFSKVIYDITNQSDLRECVREGMTAEQIAKLWDSWQNNTSRYFTFESVEKLANEFEQYVLTWEDFIELLNDSLIDVVTAVLSRPTIAESYSDLYMRYVSPMVIEQIG